MNKIRLVGVLVAGAFACASHAQIVYNNVVATVAFTPDGFENIPYATQGDQNQIIDFFAGQVPVIVGDGSGHTTAIVNIVYEVDSPFSLDSIGMVIQGSVFDFGRITFTETVEDRNNGNAIIGTASGMFLGDEYKGGTDGAFTFGDVLDLDNASTRLKVKKTFTLDIGPEELPTKSLASLGLVEQNMIPEPSTLLILGGTLTALALRRRK